MKRRRRFILALLFGGVGVLVGASLLARYSPTELRLPPCFLHEFTGLYCPGCGSTRALRRLLCGDLLGALRYNPLLVILSPYLLAEGLVALRDAWRGEYPFRPATYRLSLVVGVAVILYALLRNIPLEIFDLLRPPVGPCL